NGMLGVPGIAARTFAALHRERISVSLISQASSEHSICFSVPQASAQRARDSLNETFREEIARKEIDGVEVRMEVATLAVVGLGMAGTPGVATRVFSALSSAGINVVAIAQGSSELNISVVVDAPQAALALRRIHAAFQLSKIGGGAVARAERADLVLLGFGQIGRALASLIARRRARPRTLQIVAVIDRSGSVFQPRGISNGQLAALAKAKSAGLPLAELPGGRAGAAEAAVAFVARHALSRPILVDLTADETGPILRRAVAAGMNLVLANKRPLSGPHSEAEALSAMARIHGRRILHETTVGAGLPIIDTYYKLVESGDRVSRIEGCLSGTLGFLLTEIGRGRRFSESLRRAMAKGYTEPDPRDDLSGMDVGRKALILGRLLGYPGELQSVQLESLVPDSARGLSLKTFLDRLERYDDEWERRAEAARAKGGALRYVVTVTRRRISVGLMAVDGSSPFAALKGTDNQVAFTTARYASNPLVITGPGAGPAVTAAGVLNDVLELA
ncbi:MAG: ACT domain-containing protein, partial [Gemmatimonadales bacterium]